MNNEYSDRLGRKQEAGGKAVVQGKCDYRETRWKVVLGFSAYLTVKLPDLAD